ncbi:hypothetical protein WA026_008128 [Henosepilachna vigintioctopunctata]|uniref:Uncharacterized protein n=1 Tax=Henosepilachna vigintioctopunctata TaxID=420089 RepID=A0AAW1TPH4_9CUCU
MSNRGDYGDVAATLPEDMVGLYFDEEENFAFQDYLLAECNQTATTNGNNTMKSEELDSFSKVKHFVLDKYNAFACAEASVIGVAPAIGLGVPALGVPAAVGVAGVGVPIGLPIGHGIGHGGVLIG